jgi:hypothetical protein
MDHAKERTRVAGAKANQPVQKCHKKTNHQKDAKRIYSNRQQTAAESKAQRFGCQHSFTQVLVSFV